jgi:hypothetical protein
VAERNNSPNNAQIRNDGFEGKSTMDITLESQKEASRGSLTQGRKDAEARGEKTAEFDRGLRVWTRMKSRLLSLPNPDLKCLALFFQTNPPLPQQKPIFTGKS